jgi:ABC-type bacteriocin/lantibiotic exporter with double-glycine peptidase domain
MFLTPTPTQIPLLSSYVIPLRTQVFQTFNNCGPASLSMLLSYYDINVSQDIIGKALRPYQNAAGINDDKSVFVSELAEEAQITYGLLSYYRPNGTIERMKRLLASGYPILVRTWLESNDDIGHYRILRGYDDVAGVFIQDDSYQGKNIHIPYGQFNNMWKAFHYEYLVLAKPEQKDYIEFLLGEKSDYQVTWDHMYKRAQQELQESPSESAYSNFSLSVASFHKGDYQQSVDYYEQSKNGLPEECCGIK